MTDEEATPRADDTLCAEHRSGKPGEPHEWRRGRRGHTVVVTCHPMTAPSPSAPAHDSRSADDLRVMSDEEWEALPEDVKRHREHVVAKAMEQAERAHGGGCCTTQDLQTALAVLLWLSEQRTGNGRLRDAIALVRTELHEEAER